MTAEASTFIPVLMGFVIGAVAVLIGIWVRGRRFGAMTVRDLIEDWHADVPHLDQGDPHPDGHYDLHGDMPHWDHDDDSDFDPGRDFVTNPVERILESQQDTARQLVDMLGLVEQRLAAVEQQLARR